MATRDLTPDEVRRVEHLEREVVAIDRSADGRALTPNQQANRAAHIQEMTAILDGIEFGRGYGAAAAGEFAKTGDPAYAHEAARANRADQLGRMAAQIRGPRPPEGSMSNIEASGDIRSLITTYLERGYAVAEFPFDGVDLRALSSSVGTNVPQKFVQRLTVYERDAAPMLDPAIVSMNAVDRGGEYVFPLLSADAAGGGTVTVEAGGITEADATLSAATAQPYKLASMQLWSNELNTDNVINLEAALARTGGREIGINANALLTTGDGSSKPEGFVTAATNGGTAQGTAQGESTDAYFSIWDIADVWYGLPASVRDRSTFMVSSTAMAKITKARDSNGFPVVEQFSVRGRPHSVRGEPTCGLNAAMAAVASASISVAVGDFSAYEVVRLPVRVELSNHYRFGNDQVALRVIERIDGKLVDTTAIRYMVSADS